MLEIIQHLSPPPPALLSQQCPIFRFYLEYFLMHISTFSTSGIFSGTFSISEIFSDAKFKIFHIRNIFCSTIQHFPYPEYFLEHFPYREFFWNIFHIWSIFSCRFQNFPYREYFLPQISTFSLSGIFSVAHFNIFHIWNILYCAFKKIHIWSIFCCSFQNLPG